MAPVPDVPKDLAGVTDNVLKPGDPGGPWEGFVRPVGADEVELGAPLAWSVYDREGKLLFVQGMVLASQTHIDLVLERGMLVPDTAVTEGVLVAEFDRLADDTQAEEGSDDTEQDAEDDQPPAEPEPPVFREMQKLRRELRALHDELLQRSGEPLTEPLLELASRLRALVARDADAALAAMQLDVGDDGQITRLLHAATLCDLLVRARDWDEEEGLSIIAAALTYDVALNPFATAMNQQQAELSADQRQLIADHPQAGVELLQQAGVEDPVWLAAVLQHHERVDGSGYPNGLSGEAISRGARKLAIADIYSAMVR